MTRGGTGKTYAAAFAMRHFGFNKVLFVVHRNQIAKQAMKSFCKVFGESVSMGMFSGTLNKKEIDRDYVFATIQTLSKDENLCLFKQEHFEAIIYDDERVIIRTKLEKPSKIKGLALI